VTSPRIEYADRIVRYLGVVSYRIQPGKPGEWSIIDSRGGKTIGMVRWTALATRGNELVKPQPVVGLVVEPISPPDAPLSKVIAAWEEWCLGNGKEPWPR
jgi:hypothetical protein